MQNVEKNFSGNKLNAKNFGITLKTLQFDKKVISRSAFFIFIDNFSNLCSFDVDNWLYFCKYIYIYIFAILLQICYIFHDVSRIKQFFNVKISEQIFWSII